MAVHHIHPITIIHSFFWTRNFPMNQNICLSDCWSIFPKIFITKCNIYIQGVFNQKCLIACKKGINVVVRFQYSEIGWLENSTFQRQLKTHKKVDFDRHLEDELSVASYASSSSKTLWGRMKTVSPWSPFRGQFRKKERKLFLSFLQMLVGVHFLCVFNCLWKVEFSSQPIYEY